MPFSALCSSSLRTQSEHTNTSSIRSRQRLQSSELHFVHAATTGSSGCLGQGRADSPSVDAWMVAVTLIGFTLIYAILGGVAVWLGVRFIKKGAPAPAPSDEKGAEDLSQPSMAY